MRWGYYTKEGVHMGANTRHTYVNQVLKNGKFGKRFDCVVYTPLNNCELCGLLGTPKKVSHRWDVYGWDLNMNEKAESPGLHKCLFCTGCWNKVKPIAKAKKEAREIRYLTGKLYRETLKWQKLQTPAN